MPHVNPLVRFGRDSASLPAFDAIGAEHVVEGIRIAVDDHAQAMEACRAMPGDPALLARKEAADLALNQSWGIVGHLLSVTSSPALRAAHAEAQAIIDAHLAAIGQDKALHAAMAQIPTDALSPENRRALTLALQQFELSGVALEGEAAARFSTNWMALSRLSTAFSNAVLDATQAWTLHVTDAEMLRGIPEASRAGMAAAAEQAGLTGWLVTLHAPSYLAVMSHAEDRDLRRQLYAAFGTRASDQGPNAGQFDNSATMREILRLRADQALALGFEDPVAQSLATKMAPDATTVESFLLRLAQLARPKAEADLGDLRAFAAEQLGIETLAPWDIPFVTERLRQARHALDSAEIRDHLPLAKVLGALFAVVGELFDVEVREGAGTALWHADARSFEIHRRGAAAGADPIAALFADMFARDGKRGGAWMNTCRAYQDGGAIWPIAYLVTNFAPPAPGTAATITHDEMVTLFHEMGHVLHHLLSPVDVPSVAGVAGVEWDAVELPSQFLENFAWEPAVLKAASAHVETGAPLSDALIERMLGARHFQLAPLLLRQVEFALFDLRLHRAAGGPNAPDPQAILEAVREEVALVRPPEWHRFAHAFSHIFAGGYAAGYYSYLWAELLSSDAYAAFEGPAADRRALGARFRQEVLSPGGSRPAMENFVAFRGREPSEAALLEAWGIAA
ncbi:M3 family metallopeptidase [Sphingomonas sp. R1]|uniref:M3 family metallopeptidase n=1 Tax=Sphingomonas sp. R1 TaxID=399176 RepID=UPI002224FB42|nr:M3 family metallopeptidase [Sphingomonas sp. R1]UYY79486.1 M3 family metallopeptidase [Sphingomonas sp. R1]